MPVAPAISRSLAILVSAAMLISFIADSEIVWAGADVDGAAAAGAGAGAAAGAPAAGTAAAAVSFFSGFSGFSAFSGGAVATPPFGLAGLRSSSTGHPVLRLCALRPAPPAYQTTFRIHEHDERVPRGSACQLSWPRPPAHRAATESIPRRPCPRPDPDAARPRAGAPHGRPADRNTPRSMRGFPPRRRHGRSAPRCPWWRVRTRSLASQRGSAARKSPASLDRR